MATPPLLPRVRRPIGPPYAPALGRRARVRRWQDSRTWARLIREAEALWHVDVRDLRRLGALELGELLQEVPPRLRSRVNRWLVRYGVVTRLDESMKKPAGEAGCEAKVVDFVGIEIQ